MKRKYSVEQKKYVYTLKKAEIETRRRKQRQLLTGVVELRDQTEARDPLWSKEGGSFVL